MRQNGTLTGCSAICMRCKNENRNAEMSTNVTVLHGKVKHYMAARLGTSTPRSHGPESVLVTAPYHNFVASQDRNRAGNRTLRADCIHSMVCRVRCSYRWDLLLFPY